MRPTRRQRRDRETRRGTGVVVGVFPELVGGWALGAAPRTV